MERSDQESIDSFIAIAGVSESVAIQKLQEHGGDLNRALDAYFAESNENNVPVTNVSRPRQDLPLLDDLDDFRTGLPLLSATAEIFDRLFGTNNNRSPFREPRFFPSRLIDDSNFRSPLFPEREPFVSHPREVRQIPIEVKDSNGSSSSPRHAPTIVDVTDTEHDHGPGISGVVTMDDDDCDSVNEMHPRTTEVDYASDNNIPAGSAQTNMQNYLDNDDIEEQMIAAVLEVSRREAGEKQSAKSFETGKDVDLVEDTEDAEECPLVWQKANSLSSSFKDSPKEHADNAPLKFSSTADQDQNIISPSLSREESDNQKQRLPEEPLPDEENVVTILIRMSDGRRFSRRFRKFDKLQVVFDFIQTCGGVHQGSYKLARSYPRRTFSEADGALTLEEIGITAKQEALYVESV